MKVSNHDRLETDHIVGLVGVAFSLTIDTVRRVPLGSVQSSDNCLFSELSCCRIVGEVPELGIDANV